MSAYKRLIAMIEGNRDKDFIDCIVKPIMIELKGYSDVITYKFPRIPEHMNKRYVEAVLSMNDDILCFTDVTGFRSKKDKKEQVQRDHIGNIGDDRVIIIIKEIESWYLAGVGRPCCGRLRIDYYGRTDTINKEKFHEIIASSKFTPRSVCCLEMLRNYDVELAKQRNKSFNCFYANHIS